MIGIVDYGLGNIKAISNIYDKLKIRNKLIKAESDFENVDRLILPGVGAFDSAIEMLKKSKLYNKIDNLVVNDQFKILGICVGMQIFSIKSSEGSLSGFNWIEGDVKKFEVNNSIMRLPHMGWNSVNIKKNLLFNNISDNEYFYFCHSYYFNCIDSKNIMSETKFINNFASSINYKNIYGIQFHPEKSHDNGIKILKNFSEI
tara:strand:- start:182 stop:787 length:606 start_codon:yes stop_codon:yes gene_type:complete